LPDGVVTALDWWAVSAGNFRNQAGGIAAGWTLISPLLGRNQKKQFSH